MVQGSTSEGPDVPSSCRPGYLSQAEPVSHWPRLTEACPNPRGKSLQMTRFKALVWRRDGVTVRLLSYWRERQPGQGWSL